jgi:hypothetical protein
MSGFATEAAAAAGTDTEAPLHPSAALHARRARQKPQNSNRNAFHRAEKKQLQIRVHLRQLRSVVLTLATAELSC